MDPNTSSICEGKPIFVVVMGVSGSGKTTVGLAVAAHLNLTFLDADTLHPACNIQKMKSGSPLNDEDRLKWLQNISEKMNASLVKGRHGLVIGCSALKIKYRRILRGFSYDYEPATEPVMERQVHFLYLKGTYSELIFRIQGRLNHFMPPNLLQSQLDALEEPTEDESVNDKNQSQGKLVILGIYSIPENIADEFVHAITSGPH